MKKRFPLFLLITLSASILFTACAKKSQSTKTSPGQSNKDNPTHKKTTLTKKKPLFDSSTFIANKYVVVTMPPTDVAAALKLRYPSVTNVVWAKEKVKSETNKADSYKASFVFDETKHWILYSNTGQQLELRIQILPDQLPQNIYNVIKNKYAEAHIISAATYKSLANQGAYVTIITPQPNEQEMELILMEDGTFIH